MALLVWRLAAKGVANYIAARSIFVLYMGAYILLSFLLTGILVHPIEQYLYLLNVIAILIVSARMHEPFALRDEKSSTWLVTALSAVVALAFLTLVVLGCNTKMMDTVGRF